MCEVRQLGVLGEFVSQEIYARRKPDLAGLAGALGADLRRSVADYLRRESIVFAIMEYTEDVLDGKFGTSGGSALLIDGTFFWRGDAADYVETYGISPGDAFLEWAASHDWQPPTLTLDEIADIDGYLSARFQGGS